MLSRAALLAFMRQERYAVQSSVSPDSRPQAALVGIAVTEQFEIIFDTLASSRKAPNLRHNPRTAFVIGPALASTQRTVQLEGFADEPSGSELDRLLAIYFEAFPDGRPRQNWPGLIYFRVKPAWLRYSDYSADPPEFLELRGSEITAL